jgi:hypothetical protein
MGVVVGLRSAAGIVVCANQQLSLRGAPKSLECKLAIIPGRPIVFAHSGQFGLAKEAREKIKEKIGEAEVPSSLLYLAADEVLTGMRKQYSELDLQLLIGTSAATEEPTLFRFDGKELQVADEFNFLGVEDPRLLRFLAAMMHSLKLNIDEIASLAIYLVRKTEEYIEPCNGPIDLAILKSGDQSCRLLLEEDVQRIIRKVEEKEGRTIPLNARSAST